MCECSKTLEQAAGSVGVGAALEVHIDDVGDRRWLLPRPAAQRSTGQRVGLKQPVPDNERAADEQVPHAPGRANRVGVRRVVSHGQRIDHDEVRVRARRQVALRPSTRRDLVETVNQAGGEVLLDERVRRDGSHHQKLFVVRHPDTPDDDVAFVGRSGEVVIDVGQIVGRKIGKESFGGFLTVGNGDVAGDHEDGIFGGVDRVVEVFHVVEGDTVETFESGEAAEGVVGVDGGGELAGGDGFGVFELDLEAAEGLGLEVGELVLGEGGVEEDVGEDVGGVVELPSGEKLKVQSAPPPTVA